MILVLNDVFVFLSVLLCEWFLLCLCKFIVMMFMILYCLRRDRSVFVTSDYVNVVCGYLCNRNSVVCDFLVDVLNVVFVFLDVYM